MNIKVYTIGNDDGTWLITSDAEEVKDNLLLFSDGRVKKQEEVDIWEYAVQNCCNIGDGEFDKLMNMIPEDERGKFRRKFVENRNSAIY